MAAPFPGPPGKRKGPYPAPDSYQQAERCDPIQPHAACLSQAHPYHIFRIFFYTPPEPCPSSVLSGGIEIFSFPPNLHFILL